MSIVLSTEIDIAATPEEVWAVLSDFTSYGEWSNFSRVTGTAETGSTLAMRMPGMTFRSTVTAAEPNSTLQWSARIISAKLFLGQHTFTLTRRADGTTHLDNTETFSGAIVRPFQGLFARTHQDSGYAAFNRALKARVERRADASRTGTVLSDAPGR